MEYHHLLAALVIGQWNEDNGSGPPPAVPEWEADMRRAARRATPAPEPVRTGAAGWRLRRRRVSATPATVT
ncbi:MULTISPECIES: hypothetical protein [Streptomyces]|uniref:Uncharacterized protein n=2 Tax=Streptomyces TaxID=1883 RepID=A0A5N5ZUR6_9ACTN|nr:MULTISPECIES: hypothetical protein [Streptomyces]KAB8160244.1 hypothetical protein FH607_026900 [Streptomyces mimosae]KAB8172994.1 hypothetical protein FH609_028265 [Streptomyces sp. 3MP-14]RMI36160.1 hypothetical protein EBN88_22250 [Streptomyces triticirhizae]